MVLRKKKIYENEQNKKYTGLKANLFHNAIWLCANKSNKYASRV